MYKELTKELYIFSKNTENVQKVRFFGEKAE